MLTDMMTVVHHKRKTLYSKLPLMLFSILHSKIEMPINCCVRSFVCLFVLALICRQTLPKGILKKGEHQSQAGWQES